jgi:hypothetical protein
MATPLDAKSVLTECMSKRRTVFATIVISMMTKRCALTARREMMKRVLSVTSVSKDLSIKMASVRNVN